MSTLYQLIKNPRISKLHKNKSPLLYKHPQKKVICLKLFTKSPKKPNSAKRKVAQVCFTKILSAFSTKKIMFLAYIPGESHTLQSNAVVLCRGGRVKDLPGVRYHLIRGVHEFSGVKNRKNARSKYGTKKIKLAVK